MAIKKIIDILPPDKKRKLEEKTDKFVSSVLPSKKNNPKFFAIAPKNKNQVVVHIKKTVEPSQVKEEKIEQKFQIPQELKSFKFSLPVSFLRKKAIFLMPLAAFFGIFLLSVKFSTATIEIWPKTEKISFEAKLNLDKKIKEYNSLTNNSLTNNSLVNSIPADVIEKEKTVSGTFPATGKSTNEKKAEGVITVYNNYSSSYQVLVANTRFVSTEGKVFRTVERIMIPGATSEGGKMKAGEINIRIVADQPGAEYNIESDTFSIPGFAGTDRYTKFYAKSFQPFTGGSSESVAEATATDLNKAEDVLMRQAKEEAEGLLKNDLKTENAAAVFSFLENNIQTEIIEKIPSVQVGAAANDFTFQMKAKAKTIVFKKEDINNFVKNYISDKIPEGKKVYDPSLKIDYSVESVNFDSGLAQVVLKISADVYSDVDEKALKNNISQKSLSEIKLFLSAQPEISGVLVKVWPFWVVKAPKDIDRIKLKVNFGESQ